MRLWDNLHALLAVVVFLCPVYRVRLCAL